MRTAIAKLGNSLAQRLPRSVIDETQLGEGTLVEITVEGTSVTFRPARPRFRLDDLLDQCQGGAATDEDRQWIGGPPAGNELI